MKLRNTFRNTVRVILVGGTLAYLACSALPASATGIDSGVLQLKNAVFEDAAPADPSPDPAADPAAPPADPAPAPEGN
jgi:hypothetical protein